MLGVRDATGEGNRKALLQSLIPRLILEGPRGGRKGGTV